MREIKFRAWDKEIKEMRKHLTLDVTSGEVTEAYCSPKREDGFTYWDIKPMPQISLMQYTGLKDKNGVEVYEGDIVRKRYSDKHGYEVYWHLFTACWMLRHPHRSGFIGIDKGDMALMCEVIGNIYENQELVS